MNETKAFDNTYGSRILFHKTKLNNIFDLPKDCFQSFTSPASKPVFMHAREKLISFLGCVNKDFSTKKSYKIIWNHIFPSMFLLILFINRVIKQDFVSCMLLLAFAFKWIIIFLTCPSNWFMYYLSYYLFGYIVLFYGFLYLYLKYKKRRVYSNE